MNELMITLLENDWLLYAVCGAAGVGALIQIVLSVSYNRSLNASERMRNTKIAWLRQMKTRYESGYEWNNRIRNVELFVDKNIGRRKWMGIYLKTWEELGKMMLPLVLVLSALGAVCAGTYMEEKTVALMYLAVGAVLAVMLRGMSALANLKEKQRLLRTNLCDYFENTLQSEAKNRRREQMREQETYFGKQVLREELACAVEGTDNVKRSEPKEEKKVCEKTERMSDEERETEQQERGQNADSKLQMEQETAEAEYRNVAVVKNEKAAARSNKKALRQEKKREKQLSRLAKKEVKSLRKQEKKVEKENAKLQRKQAKEQKRVDKLTRRMEKMQLRLGTAATAECVNLPHTVGGKKDENARLKREQLKRKVDVTPTQEDQIISEVLREFLA